MWGKIVENEYSTFILWCCLPFVHVVFQDVFCVLLLVVLFVLLLAALCVLLSSHVYLLYCVGIALFTLNAVLLSRNQ